MEKSFAEAQLNQEDQVKVKGGTKVSRSRPLTGMYNGALLSLDGEHCSNGCENGGS